MYAEAILSAFSQRYAGARDKFISAVETSSIVEWINNIAHPLRGPKNERLFQKCFGTGFRGTWS